MTVYAGNIIPRFDTAANLASSNRVYADGELVYNRTNRALAVGDGSTAYNALTPMPVTLLPTVVKTAAYTAAVGEVVNCDASGGAFTVTLPSAPPHGSTVAVRNQTAGAVTIARGGTDVFNAAGGATSVAQDQQWQTTTFTYYSGVWYQLSNSLPDIAVRGTLFDAKGDLLVGTADNTYTRQAVGADGTVLQADSAQGDGLKWSGDLRDDVLRVVDNADATKKLVFEIAPIDTGQTRTLWVPNVTGLVDLDMIACRNGTTRTLVSQTAAQSIFGVGLTLPVGRYRFEMFVALTSMSSTSGNYGFAMGGTAVIGSQLWPWQAEKALLPRAASTTAPNSGIGTAAVTSLVQLNNTTTSGWFSITGTFRVTAAGTWIPQVSLTVAAAAVVSADSYCTVQQIATDLTTTQVGAWA